MPTIDQYAVFGHPINHSKSPRIHQLFAGQTQQKLSYIAQDVPPQAFTTCVQEFFASGGKGLNCTIPLKELAWKHADNLTDRARLSKAVNTLALQPDGSILGENTDGIGLVKDLTANHIISLTDCRILIIGAGGATRGILAPLLEQKPTVIYIVNRTPAKADILADEFKHMGSVVSQQFSNLNHQQFDLIINATPTSLSGELPPLGSELLKDQGCCYDLAYSDRPTAFVLWGISQNARKSLDGLGMLVEQAAESFALWRHVRPETTAVIDLLNSERNQAGHQP